MLPARPVMQRDPQIPGTPISPDGILRYVAPCECDDCRQQFLTLEQQCTSIFWYESVITPPAARTLLADFINRINTDRAYLANLCNNFGNTIASRWRKKSRDKREALLLLADPTIEKKPWFRIRMETEEVKLLDTRNSRRKSWLLPYMSTAIMKANPSVLMGLIYNRIHHSPEEWAPFDNALISHGFVTGDLGLEYCGQACVVMHGIDYGMLVPWKKEAAERWDIVGYPRARLIIEAQALMFSRLRSIMDLILEGVDRNSTGTSDKWQDMVRTGFKQANTIELWSDYINQPFSSPPNFDVDYYCSVARARMQAAEDHLWLLQTDPSYVRRFIKVMAVGEVYRSEWKHLLIVGDIGVDLLHCLRWSYLSKEWSSVRDQYRRFRDSIHPGQPLPRGLEISLAILEQALVDSMDKLAKHLSVFITQRPGFRQYYKFTMPKRGTGCTSQQICANVENIMGCTETEQYHRDPLDWTLMQLLGETDTEFRIDHAELFAKLEAHLADADYQERNRLHETLYARFSDFAAQHEMFSAIRMHRPASSRRGPDEIERMIKENSTSFTRSLAVRDSGLDVGSCVIPSRFFESFDKLEPAIGRKDKAWLDRRVEERKALANFWEQTGKTLRESLGYTRMEQREIDNAISLISVSTTKEYVDMVETERAEVMDLIAAAALSKEAASTATPTDTFWETGPDVSRLAINEQAPKTKTRPSQPVNRSPDESEPSKLATKADTESHGQPQMPATPRALEIIKKMFPTSAEESSAKDTDWDLFVHAMSDLTFSARNVGGSAVAFEHPSRKKIIFHRPHPVAKIDSIMLQSMGKRLKKHFDWSREAFIGV